jgi:hypothetical protein
MALKRVAEFMKSTDPVVGPDAEQTFFADPAIDRLLGMVLSLSAELHVLRDRVALLEAELERGGALEAGRLDRIVPDGALEARIGAERAALVRHLLEGLPGRLASKS